LNTTDAEDNGIQVTLDSAPYVEEIKKLADANSKTLGFFPAGAFDEQSTRKQILIATDQSRVLLGYLLFRYSRQRAMIVHLCVDPKFRRKGIAKHLVTELKDLTKESFLGIGLSCRRDYEARKVWPQLGFIPRGERAGRRKGGSILTFWWYDFNHPNLFTKSEDDSEIGKLNAIIDANVFFGFREESKEALESKGLMSDWLKDFVTLSITSELYNEIDRNPDILVRKKARSFASEFKIVNAQSEDIDQLEPHLRSVVGQPKNESDQSDIRQLANCIIGGVRLFITCENYLLDMSDVIYNQFGVNVIRPLEVIQDIDKLERAIEYEPARIAGTLKEWRHLETADITSAVRKFQNYEKGERKGGFLTMIRSSLSDPKSFSVFAVCAKASHVDALVILDHSKVRVLEVLLLRVEKGATSSTLFRYLTHLAIERSIEERKSLTIISDPYLASESIASLEAEGYVKVGGAWIKFSLPVVCRISEAIEEIAEGLKLIELKNTEFQSFKNNLLSLAKSRNLIELLKLVPFLKNNLVHLN
jgi:ribosomal protein S18 acetylase RimI-like enzyme